MRLLFLNPSGEPGGAEIALLDILASLRQAEPAWQLRLILGQDGPVAERARQLGVEVDIVAYPPAIARLGDAGAGGPAGRQVGRLGLALRVIAAAPALAQYRRELRRAILAAGPDVIHSNGFKMHILGMWARPRRVPIVWYIHDFVAQRPLMRALLRHYAGQCRAAVANSHSTAADLERVCGARLKVHCVYNGVDLDRFSPVGSRADLEQIAGLPPAPGGTIRIGLMATLARWKGHAVFLRALAILMARLPASIPVVGYVIGGAIYQTDGSQYTLDELRTLARESGMEQRVGFTGFLAAPETALRALDIVVHASTQPEPFGLAIVEAMACGKPVIASDAGGAAEIVALGEGAIGHPPGDADALAAAMERLVLDANLRARMGREARRTAEQFFDRARLAKELIPVYREAARAESEPRITKQGPQIDQTKKMEPQINADERG